MSRTEIACSAAPTGTAAIRTHHDAARTKSLQLWGTTTLLYSLAHACGTGLRSERSEAHRHRPLAPVDRQRTYSSWNSTLSRSRSRLMPLAPLRCLAYRRLWLTL